MTRSTRPGGRPEELSPTKGPASRAPGGAPTNGQSPATPQSPAASFGEAAPSDGHGAFRGSLVPLRRRKACQLVVPRPSPGPDRTGTAVSAERTFQNGHRRWRRRSWAS
ncbi:hypothetical protein CMUS01_07549 [Colletotrichum musicola]|uniref:Uncharacterized protein n=1 Tax=Colletotrichum musicola TaxID=2175873 RepID=A0A8H6KGJ7_9PEZI|nr:hypothetical protein CMUS01_07549 [Colletotrichum musicola]